MLQRTPPRAIGLARVVLAVVIVAAVFATHLDAASRVPVNPFNLYGYFTVQSNLIAAVSWLAAGILTLRGRTRGTVLSVLGAIATTCLVIVGLVYAILLAPLGAPGGVPVPWANTVLHLIAPIAVVADWIGVRDRAVLAASVVWVILLYPLTWTTVVLIRGASDGWVPYPFLDPAQGYGTVSLYVVAIAALFAVVGTAVLWISRRMPARDSGSERTAR